MLHNIPEEQRQLPQWILWKYEQESPDTKLVKRPMNPKNGHYASPTNPDHWVTFEEAVAVMDKYDGIGFVITKDDPYICIDLDASDDPEVIQRQKAIYAAFDSYSEISPSGNGCHIWIKASVAANRNRSKVEMYTAGHYMTMTGKVIRNVPIREYQSLAMQLWQEMEVKPKTEGIYLNKPEVHSDEDILTLASLAVNGEKFINLYDGKWQEYFPGEAHKKEISCNEADQALTNILAFYTQNREQIKRIFRASVLGQRKKALREDYFEHPRWGMLNKAFDKMPPELDLDTLKNKLEDQLAVKRQQAAVKSQEPPVNIPKPEYTDSCILQMTPPPGLVGEIAKFIYNAAPRPVPEIAIAAAIGLMSGVCGRAYNVSGTGLNNYVFLLAETGSGKEALQGGISKLMAEIIKTVPAANGFVGPSKIASSPALMKYISKISNSFVSIFGEFADTLRKMSSESRDHNKQDLRIDMLDLYNKSGNRDMLGDLIYSDKDKNTGAVKSPAFSILGEAVPEKFYELLNKQMITEGLLPRCLIIEYHGKRPQLNENHLTAIPSPQLIDYFSSICAYSLQLNNGNNALNVGIDAESQNLLDQFNVYCDKRINEGTEVNKQLWNRAHIKVLKLSALLAVGCNYINPVINLECAKWALRVVTTDINNLLSRFDAGDIGTNNVQNDQVTEIKKAIRKYVTETWETLQNHPGATLQTHSVKIIPHSFISAYCRGRSCFKSDRLAPIAAIKICLESMIQCDDIRELSPLDKKGKGIAVNGRCYVISEMKI